MVFVSWDSASTESAHTNMEGVSVKVGKVSWYIFLEVWFLCEKFEFIMFHFSIFVCLEEPIGADSGYLVESEENNVEGSFHATTNPEGGPC